MSDFRIVVTGSRDWPDGETGNLIRNKLALAVHAATELGAAPLMSSKCVTREEIVVVQGGAAGVDAIARADAERDGLRVETFAADWERHGKAAGPIRNAEMLDAGAEFVLAFPFGGRSDSPGTWDCVDKAIARGIPVAIFPAEMPG